MIRYFNDAIPCITLGAISLATVGSIISILSGIAALVYTGMKIYDRYESRKSKNSK